MMSSRKKRKKKDELGKTIRAQNFPNSKRPQSGGSQMRGKRIRKKHINGIFEGCPVRKDEENDPDGIDKSDCGGEEEGGTYRPGLGRSGNKDARHGGTLREKLSCNKAPCSV